MRQINCKLLTSTFFLVFGLSIISAQIVEIPDENFKSALIASGVDQNNDEEIQFSEAAEITELNLEDSSIKNIAGINAFINLLHLNLRLNVLDSFYSVQLPQLEYLNVGLNLSLKFIELDGVPNITYFSVSSNKEITEISFENTPLIDTLKLGYTDIQSVDLSNLEHLAYLDLSRMELNSLDLSHNPLLTFIRCSGNQLSTLDLSKNELLEIINCSQNQLETLILPVSSELKMLECKDNSLSSLDITNNVNLQELNCSDNLLQTLDISPLSKLNAIRSSDNQLTDITFGWQPELENVSVNNNKLTEVNILDTSSIVFLNLDNNLFSEFDPYRYPNLSGIHLANNLLKEIDLSRSNIGWVDVSGNQLKELDLSNNDELDFLHCRDNQLEYINVKNDAKNFLFNFSFSGNDDLKHICSVEKNVNIISNIVEIIGLENCTVSSYCDFLPGEDHNIFKGTLLYDNGNNFCTDGSFPLRNQQLDILIGSQSERFISDGTGSVTIPLAGNAFTIVPKIPNDHLFNIIPDSVFLSYPEDSNYMEQKFCIFPIDWEDDLSIYLYPLDEAVPGFPVEYKIKVQNHGTSISSFEVRLGYQSEYMSILSASQPWEEGPDQLSWQHYNLSPFKTFDITFKMKMNTPMDSPPLNQNDLLQFIAHVVTPIETDISPENNIFFLNQIVVNSFDPNDKTCLQGEVIMDTTLGTYLDYLIRFENLGTANAKNIVVKDVLKPWFFDLTSIEITDASHPVFTRVKNDYIEFIFEDINLSFQDSINDGFIAFKIKPNPDFLQAGDTIKNAAEIFFDYNFPIVTNTYNTVIATDQDMDGFNNIVDCDDNNAFIFPGAEEIPNNGIDEDCDGMDFIVSTTDLEQEKIWIYPNPATNSITLSKMVDQVEFYDFLGQKLITKNNVNQIDISILPRGLFYLKISEDGFRHSQTLIKH